MDIVTLLYVLIGLEVVGLVGLIWVLNRNGRGGY